MKKAKKKNKKWLGESEDNIEMSNETKGLFCTDQCCNEDWKCNEDEYEDSLVSYNGPKTNTKNLC